MASTHRRARKLEAETARTLGVERVRRRHVYQTAPDTTPLRLPTGDVLQPECKTRKRLPRVLIDALEQAIRYTPTAIPMAVIQEHAGRALVVLPLDAFARLIGVQPRVLGEQLALGRPA